MIADPTTRVAGVLNTPLFTVGRTPVTATTLAVFVIVFVFTVLVARLAARGTRRAFSVRGVTDQGLVGFGDSSVDFDVSVWTQDPWGSRQDLSNLNHAIWTGLKTAGITIPFPQRDVHVIPVAGAIACH